MVGAYAGTAQAYFFHNAVKALHFNCITGAERFIEKNDKGRDKIFNAFFGCQGNGRAYNT